MFGLMGWLLLYCLVIQYMVLSSRVYNVRYCVAEIKMH